jgi:transposase-like protein
MQFKSLPELLDKLKDEATCVAYYEKIRWNGRVVCPFCGIDKAPYKTNRGYKCSDKDCGKKFTCKVGTIFENSKISLRIWFGAIFLATAHKKGISSVQLGIDLGITQKTAWFVLHRIREMLKCNAPAMIGGGTTMVEADETYIGGKEGNKHANKRRKEGEPEKKKIVLGVIERDGRVILKYIPNATAENMVPFIKQHVPEGSKVFTDEFVSYNKLGRDYVHKTVNHTVKIYVSGEVHTNTIENFWSVLKRGLYGIYHSVSEKHLDRYLHEFSSRFNERKVSEQARFEKFLAHSQKRLKYKHLIA